MIKEKSCGAVVFRNTNNGFLFLVMKHKDQDYWEFPKGHVEVGESERETALREVYEEAGLNVKLLDGFRESISFSPRENVSKTVVFFLGEAGNNNVRYVLDEMESHKWLSFEGAFQKLSFDNSRDLLRKAFVFLENRYK